ncbi:MAG: murein DD-endopeptidase MepM/ murein hydrolase activator NlpD [Polaribacter sp.]|jgi:murein DD-endopeptidase MepM/ murein hydrolase activator NlpD
MIRNSFILFLLLFISVSIFAQAEPPEAEAIEVYDEKTDKLTIGIFANNSSDTPITVTIDFPEQKNIKLRVKLPYAAVIPARVTRHHVMDITIIPGKSVSFQYGYGMVMGDTKTAKHDDDFLYHLPFKKGSSFTVGQGYNGRFSHQGTNAIDFDMDIGTKVCAARAGTVVFTKDDGRKSCQHQSCDADANYIMILHSDGSFGRYVHLDYKGISVKPGQKVKTGEVIASSGNTGYSSGPHLHFEVFVPVPNGSITVGTKFKANEGNGIYLKETETYSW